MYFICAYLIKYENGKLSQSEISRCSHLKFNGSLLAWGWRVGGRWEIFHTQNATSHVKKFSTLVSLRPYFWCTEVSGSSRKGGGMWTVSLAAWPQKHISLNHSTGDRLDLVAPCSVSWLDTGISLRLLSSNKGRVAVGCQRKPPCPTLKKKKKALP